MTEDKELANDVQNEFPRTASALIASDGTEYEIPEEGSLGLLAMGYTGIMLWRERRYGPRSAEKSPDQES